MLTLITLSLLLSAVSLAPAAAQECGGKPGFWGPANSRKVAWSGGGQGVFSTVQSAIDSVPSQNSQWVKIHITAGTYIEQVTIPVTKPCIFLEGEGSGATIIQYGASDHTDTSSTFCSQPPNIIVKGITFKNTHNLLKPLPKKYATSGFSQSQVVPALAARIYGDKSTFIDCGFVGVQDTLWDVSGRHYYLNCYIEGAVDFIFGSGQSFFENTKIYATSGGFITAQRRSTANDPSGFVFYGGQVNGAAGVETLLGRAYGPFSRVIYQSTYLSAVVDPRGWDAWHFVGHEDNFVYAEIGCSGPGADMSKRVPWEKKLSSQFSRQDFIDQDGWIERQPNN
ncbi:Putative pectinesterase 52 [Linum grandiflorum]